MNVSARENRMYICPGENHPISRAVHLARLAEFYPKCRDCPLRTETGQLPARLVEQLKSTERRVERKSLFTAEGVRGRYLNELTRIRAGRLAEALAGLLWEHAPLAGGIDSGGRGQRRTRPTVVIGHDERPSSPDIVTGVAAALRRTGCQVIDIGLTTKPCFCFGVHHLEASAGVFVTGAGCEPSWTGLDFVGRGGQPLSIAASPVHSEIQGGTARGVETPSTRRPGQGISLEQLEAQLARPFSRPTRHAGPQRTFRAAIPYRAGLWKHFHALRPLKICFGSPSDLVSGTLEHLFEKLPCQLIPVEIPRQARQLANADDAGLLRLGAAVRNSSGHLGVLIDDDHVRCAFLDETGTLITPREITRLIAAVLLAEHPDGIVVLETSAHDGLRPEMEALGAKAIDGGTTLAAASVAMCDHGAVFGGGGSGRYWFRESFPTCDAVLALAKVLEALSRSDAPFSAVIRGANSSLDTAVEI